MADTPTNEEQLKAAGLIDPHKVLTPEQSAAIEGLSKKQVDELIGTNSQLDGAVTSDNTIISMPGRIGPKPPSKP